jgi:hypothetical protein
MCECEDKNCLCELQNQRGGESGGNVIKKYGKYKPTTRIKLEESHAFMIAAQKKVSAYI